MGLQMYKNVGAKKWGEGLNIIWAYTMVVNISQTNDQKPLICILNVIIMEKFKTNFATIRYVRLLELWMGRTLFYYHMYP